MKILEPSSVYHANPALGSSLLKKIHSKTLLHALTVKQEETDSMILGSAIHCAILEPERFTSDFVVCPKVDRRTAAGKATYAEFEAAAGDKTVLTADQMEIVEGMKASIMSHPVASMMLNGGEAEYSYYHKDVTTGLELKCRPDYHNGGALIDLKTTMDASYEGFAKQMGNLGYHLQAAYYLDVFNGSQGTNYDEFFFVAIENKAPYAIAVYRLDSAQIEHGRIAYQRALSEYAGFLNSGSNMEELKTLYGYPAQITDIQIPFYILDKILTA